MTADATIAHVQRARLVLVRLHGAITRRVTARADMMTIDLNGG